MHNTIKSAGLRRIAGSSRVGSFAVATSTSRLTQYTFRCKCVRMTARRYHGAKESRRGRSGRIDVPIMCMFRESEDREDIDKEFKNMDPRNLSDEDRLEKLMALRQERAAKRAARKAAWIAKSTLPMFFEQNFSEADVLRARGLGVRLD